MSNRFLFACMLILNGPSWFLHRSTKVRRLEGGKRLWQVVVVPVGQLDNFIKPLLGKLLDTRKSPEERERKKMRERGFCASVVDEEREV